MGGLGAGLLQPEPLHQVLVALEQLCHHTGLLNCTVMLATPGFMVKDSLINIDGKNSADLASHPSSPGIYFLLPLEDFFL